MIILSKKKKMGDPNSQEAYKGLTPPTRGKEKGKKKEE